MTRTVEDSALVLSIIAGHDPADPASASGPVDDYSKGLKDGVRNLKIGLIRHFYNEDMIADAEMAEGIESAAKLLSLGAEVKEIRLPSLEQYSACNRIIMLSEAYAIHQKRPEKQAR